MNESISYQVNRPDVIDEKFDNEYVIVNLRTGAYYALNQMGAVIWRLIDAGTSRNQMLASLTANYSAEHETIAGALENLLTELEQESLILTRGDSATETPNAPPSTLSAPPKPFTLPVLERYTDMREVLQLDPIHEVDDSGWPARKVE